MVGRQKLEELQRRKEALIVRSDLDRSLMILEAQNLKTPVSYLDRGAAFMQKTRPFWLVLLPVAAFFAFKHRSQLAKAGKHLAWGMVLAQKAMTIWRSFNPSVRP